MPSYKFGKQTRPIEFETFEKAMHTKFRKPGHASYFVFLYWTGVRRSEALERTKGDFKVNDGVLYASVPAKKGGERDAPLEIDTDLPYIDLILERLRLLDEGERLWDFSGSTAWRVVKRALGKKYYPHFLRLNRATHFLDDETTTIPQMKSWFGWKGTATIDSYVGYSKRHIEAQRRRLRQEIEK